MGRLQAIRDTPDGDFTLSEVSYGLIRGLMYAREAKEVFGFKPKYELVVTRGRDVTNPICVFHYRNKRAFDLIAGAIIADGIYGSKAMQELLQSVPGDIRGTKMPSTRSMLEDEPVEISEDEREKFSRRLSEYKFRAD
jgi:hypothetical protein